MKVKYPEIVVKIPDNLRNFLILRLVTDQMTAHGVSREEIKTLLKDATATNLREAVKICAKYVSIEIDWSTLSMEHKAVSDVRDTTWGDVKKIRNMANNGIPHRVIYALYDFITPRQIRNIINETSWKE